MSADTSAGADTPTDGPGWDRETIDSICRDDLGEPHPRTAQVRALLDDRDRLERLWQQTCIHVYEMRTDRDAARAEADQLRAELTDLRDGTAADTIMRALTGDHVYLSGEVRIRLNRDDR